MSLNRELELEEALREIVQHAPPSQARLRARGVLAASQVRTPQALMRTAASLLEQAAGMLCTTGVPCRCCGTLRYDEYVEFQAHRNIAAVPARLRREADHLDGHKDSNGAMTAQGE